ncbi:nucleotide-diphospho-sugar transferase [Lactarius hatsudake]|nr:nucleotide-diphospho-sugar transferase [Lactarius hatsudake]
MSESIDTLRARYDAAGQGHLFTFWPQLSQTEQAALTAQLDTLDIARVNHIYKKAIAAEKSAAAAEEAIEPLPQDASDTVTQHPERAAEWRATGLAAVARGEVGVLLMAGGQGTRLGSSAPKGCYDIGLPSHKSLFQYQAERIARLQQVAQEEAGKPEGSVVVPWYIMTSGPTRRETEEFFKTNAYFGLKPENVVFFEQGTLPCLTMDGKVLLETKSRIAVAPDGNGGTRSVLSDLESRKVLYVVPKAHPTEAVGVVARRGAKYSVVEYSEISAAQAAARDGTTGELLFRAGNIANHFYSTAFLRRVAAFEDDLAFHIARKKIPHVALPTGAPVKPSSPNGMKLEMFVFDVFPHTERFAVLEVAREEEFSPLKNAPGTGADDPETSRRDLLAQHRRFLEAAGAAVKDGVEIELSPARDGKTFTRSGVVSSVEELEVLAA